MRLLSTRTRANAVAKLMNNGKSGSYKQKHRLMRLLSTRTNSNDVLSTRTNGNDVGKHKNKGKRG
jgi:hypothetical protein